MNVLIGIHKNLSFLMYSHMFIKKLTFFPHACFSSRFFPLQLMVPLPTNGFIEFVLHIIKSLLVVEKE